LDIQVTLPDGSVRAFPKGATVRDIAAAIGPGLLKAALAGKVDGKVVDLSRSVESDARVEIVTPKSPDAVELYRHSTAHLTANAVKRLFPHVKIGIGPAIENGYYYDFDPGRPFTPEDLAAIESEMRKIVAEDNPVERLEMSKEDAIKIFGGQGDNLKVEIIRGIPDGRISCYRQNDFIDLCRGPHVPSTGKLGVFKLTHSAGAYWKGDEHNPMLQRIYGAAFLTQAELDAHLKRIEEAKARDHRKLGKELDLFSFHPWAPASPFFHPRGAIVYNSLVEYIRELYRKYGYREIITPQIFDAELFKLSGHYENYHENMYFTVVVLVVLCVIIRRQTDELPGTLSALPRDAPVVSGPAAEILGFRPPSSLRTVRSDAGAHASADVFPGRRARLHADRQDGARNRRVHRFHRRGLQDVWIPRRPRRALDPP
jgi:threonyl-tRNA synthetase